MTLRAVAVEPITNTAQVEVGDMVSFVGGGASWYTITRRDSRTLWGVFESIWTDPEHPNKEGIVLDLDGPSRPILDFQKVKLG